MPAVAAAVFADGILLFQVRLLSRPAADSSARGIGNDYLEKTLSQAAKIAGSPDPCFRAILKFSAFVCQESGAAAYR